jgi:hypothetical protein
MTAVHTDKHPKSCNPGTGKTENIGAALITICHLICHLMKGNESTTPQTIPRTAHQGCKNPPIPNN